jgi:hypothetical protein
VKRLKYYLAAGLWLACRAAQASFGQSAALLLAEPLGVRPLGLANAFSAQADDESAIQSNPAGLSQVRGFSLGGGQLVGLLGLEASDLTLVTALSPRSSLGFEAAYLYDNDSSRDAAGNDTGTFSDSNLLAQLAFGTQISGAWRLGGAIKGLQENYAGYISNSVAGDLGVQGPLWRSLSFGAVAQNLGAQLQNSGGASPLPLRLQGGLSLPFFSDDWRLNLDLQDLPLDGQLRCLLGTELAFDLGPPDSKTGELPLRAALRGGYASGLIQGEAGQASLGAGLILPPTYALDYALVSAGDLGLIHRVSLTLRFSGARSGTAKGADLKAPTGLNVTEDAGGIVLSWQDPNDASGGVSGYNLYADYGVMIDRLNPKPVKRHFQRFVGIDKSRSYHFYLRPLGSDGQEGPSSGVCTYRAK